VQQRKKIYLKIWLRIKRPVNEIQAGSQGSKGGQSLQIGDEDFVYVLTEKHYVLHMIERSRTTDQPALISYAHADLSVLLSSVFTSKEAAQKYASFYIGPQDNPTEKKRLKGHLEDKYQTIFGKYVRGNNAHCLWEIFMTVLTEEETTRQNIVDTVFSILSLPGTELYGLVPQCKAMMKLLKAFYDYKYPQFKRTLESQFQVFTRHL